MDISIGIKGTPNSLDAEVPLNQDELKHLLRETLGEPNGILEITDTKGRLILVPAPAIGYVSVNTDMPRRVGFNI